MKPIIFDTKDFIKKAKEKHGNKYDYSKVEYVDSKTKVCIICPIHGEFWQLPNNHLRGKGCSKCKGGVKLTNEEFIKKANIKFKNFFNYSKVNYTNATTPIIITCPIHGDFWQTPQSHLHSTYGCPSCALAYRVAKRQSNTKNFIEKAKKVHGDKYDYSKVDYVDSRTKVLIICPQHGEFVQRPNTLLNG